jgi:hypothetical protein
VFAGGVGFGRLLQAGGPVGPGGLAPLAIAALGFLLLFSPELRARFQQRMADGRNLGVR